MKRSLQGKVPEVTYNAIISINGAIFKVFATKGGVERLILPEVSPLKNSSLGRKAIVRIDYHDEKKKDVYEIIYSLAEFLKDFLAGKEPGEMPLVNISNICGFKSKVLKVVNEIPRGQVRTYSWVADKAGSPKAFQATGAALSRNPVPIVIPCHRVIRSDGSIGGYAFGLEWKKHLLSLER